MKSPRIRMVGAAMTLLPHSDSVVVEAARFAEHLQAPLTLIHVGTGEAESRARMEEKARQLSIAHEKYIVWNQTDPADALLTAAKENNIELLAMGAYEGPAINRRRFLGPVARKVAEAAQCSILLIAHPRIKQQSFRRIVAITDFSDCSREACRQALWLAEKDAAEWIRIISIHTIFMDVRAGLSARDGKPARIRAEEEKMLEKFVQNLPDPGIPVEWQVIDAATGFAACDFAESMEADLLVLPGHNRPGGRMPPMADWALQVAPCSLWIVHCGSAWN